MYRIEKESIFIMPAKAAAQRFYLIKMPSEFFSSTPISFLSHCAAQMLVAPVLFFLIKYKNAAMAANLYQNGHHRAFDSEICGISKTVSG